MSSNNVWAVGQQLGAAAPDQALVEHWDGSSWSVVPVPADGSSNLVLDAVTTTPDGSQVWVAGEADTPDGGGQPLIEHWTAGSGWTVQQLPAVPDGANWSNLYGLAVNGSTVDAVGTFVNPSTDNNEVLLLSSDSGGPWSIVGAPNLGGSGGADIPGGIADIGGQLWMAGMYNPATSSNLPLIEHQ